MYFMVNDRRKSTTTRSCRIYEILTAAEDLGLCSPSSGEPSAVRPSSVRCHRRQSVMTMTSTNGVENENEIRNYEMKKKHKTMGCRKMLDLPNAFDLN